MVLIETYWNVKVDLSFALAFTIAVLIETYWNVKFFPFHASIFLPLVLIETYWNVKQTAIEYAEKHSSINRNILECKEICPDLPHRYHRVLIETYWNVKESTM